MIILSCKHVVWSRVRKISDQNAAEEATSNLGSATLGATTVQEDDAGFVTLLPGGENATWFKVYHVLHDEQDQQSQIQETKTTNSLGMISYSMNCVGGFP